MKHIPYRVRPAAQLAWLLLWLATACRPVQIAPAGSIQPTTLKGRVVFDNGENIYSANADGTDVKQLTNNPGPEFDPMWSPDGKRIVYRDSRRGVNHDDEIYVMNADGSGQRNLTNSPSSDEWGPAWSPDGNQIAFNSTRAGGPPLLYVVSADGTSEWKQIADREAEYPSWSPDGSRIVFMSQVGSTYDLYVVNSDGSGLTRLTDAPGEDGWPAWSPDGQKIAFESARDDCGVSTDPNCKRSGDIGPYFDIWIVNPDGSDQRRLSDIFGQFSSWSPDGKYILFNSFDGLDIMNADGSSLRRMPISLPGGNLLFTSWTK